MPKISLLVALLGLSGCLVMDGSSPGIEGSGVIKTETRKVQAFHAVELRGAADVQIRVGGETALSVSADDNLLPIIETAVQNGKLIVTSKEPYHTRARIVVNVATPTLDGAEISGSGDLVATDVKSESFSASITGSGDLSAIGVVKTLSAGITGSGDLKLGELTAEAVDIRISGSGSARVNAAKSLNASITGSGEITHKGGAKDVNTSITGSGSVKAVN